MSTGGWKQRDVSPCRQNSVFRHRSTRVLQWQRQRGIGLCSPLPPSSSSSSRSAPRLRSRFENNLRFEAWEFGSVLSAAAVPNWLHSVARRAANAKSSLFCEPLFLLRQCLYSVLRPLMKNEDRIDRGLRELNGKLNSVPVCLPSVPLSTGAALIPSSRTSFIRFAYNAPKEIPLQLRSARYIASDWSAISRDESTNNLERFNVRQDF